MAEDVDRVWIVAASFRVEAAADDLWRRVRLFLVELLQTEGMSLPKDLAFDRETQDGMKDLLRKQKKDRFGHHVYRAEDFGLTSNGIDDALAKYRATYLAE